MRSAINRTRLYTRKHHVVINRVLPNVQQYSPLCGSFYPLNNQNAVGASTQLSPLCSANSCRLGACEATGTHNLKTSAFSGFPEKVSDMAKFGLRSHMAIIGGSTLFSLDMLQFATSPTSLLHSCLGPGPVSI